MSTLKDDIYNFFKKPPSIKLSSQQPLNQISKVELACRLAQLVRHDLPIKRDANYFLSNEELAYYFLNNFSKKNIYNRCLSLEKENKNNTTINNLNFGDIFRPYTICLMFKWMIVLMLITSFIALVSYPVKIYSDIDCNSGNIDLNLKQYKNNETNLLESQSFELTNINNMNCKGKIRVDIPMIGLLFV